jgi:redox-sensitive bicupin YhaK (pirin superfamily)
MTAPSVLKPQPKDLGDGFTVRRVLPAIERRSVGPFIFLDEMGPVTFEAGHGLDVRPHPHIGLATVTYLFDGAIEHKDSLGTEQVIRPGDVNLMTAGRGIVHSERSPRPRNGGRLWGMQVWLALPQSHEEIAPAFEHIPAAALPSFREEGLGVRVLMGRHEAHASPVRFAAPTVYLDLQVLEPLAERPFMVDAAYAERALYVVEGAVTADGVRAEAGQMLDLGNGVDPVIAADGPARAILFGGAPLDGPRKLWWNFVSSRPERIEEAKKAWATDAMGRVEGDPERIPLPER